MALRRPLQISGAQFEFATPSRIVFGAGRAKELAQAVRAFGRRTVLVTGASPERHAGLVDAALTLPVRGEPSLDTVREGARNARTERCDVVVAIGGGSAIDAGKAIAALAANSGEPLDYIEVIGEGRALEARPLPFIAVPTTAGTGSEATRNAVLGSAEHGVKASLRSAWMLPALALVDPELTLDLPPAITASTGLDALTQLIEPYVSCRATPMTDALCVEGMRLVAASLRRAYDDGADIEARTAMSLASLYGGIALANAALGAVHGFAAPIGAMYRAPHGAVCAALLPHAMRVNIEALRSRMPRSDALRRYDDVAALLTGKSAAAAEEGVAWIASLCEDLRVAPLARYGVAEPDAFAICGKAAQASSMKGNPIALTERELRDILLRAIG